MARYGIATLLEDHEVGYEFTDSNIPLHLTHVDSFEVDLNVSQLAAKLEKALLSQKKFKLKAASDALLGPDKDIPVTMLELTPELISLHTVIMDMLETENTRLKNPQFHRDGYGPHVSIYGTRRIFTGEEVFIRDVSIGIKIGDGIDGKHRIVATIALN